MAKFISALCYIAIATVVVVAAFKAIAAKTHFSHVSHPHYSPEYLDKYKIQDFTKADPKAPIYIHLTEGGYGDRYIFPPGVREYRIKKSTNPGDYATVWCNGHPNPTPIVEAYTAGMGGEITAGCRDNDDPKDLTNDFRVQGQGDLIFYPTVYNH